VTSQKPRTLISTPEVTAYSDLPLDEALALLNEGEPIECWWYTPSGKKHTETWVFTEYSYVRTALND